MSTPNQNHQAGPQPMHVSLATVPQEVLEHIAYFAGTDSLLGPPSSLVSLLLTNRQIHSSLDISTNHHLYARIFAHKFDANAPMARFGAARLTAYALADELRRRFAVLRRIRGRKDSTTHVWHGSEAQGEAISLRDILFTAYFLLLENEGKNKAQLLEYGQMRHWIHEFWFDPHGSSLAIYNIRIGQWPFNKVENSLAMWIFWFLLDKGGYPYGNTDSVDSPLSILKAMALGAHRYNLTVTPWTEFEPRFSRASTTATLYSETMELHPPPLATPAILSFLALINKKRSIPLPPSDAPLPEYPYQGMGFRMGPVSRAVQEYLQPLLQTRKVGDEHFHSSSTHNTASTFRSIEGVWEGFFTYTEFTAYAALLAGAPPPVIQKSVVGRHQQTWKLREHHLVVADPADSDSGIDVAESDTAIPLRGGDPLRSYFPTGTQIMEQRDGLIVRHLASDQVYSYRRPSLAELRRHNEDQNDVSVQDIIITGEGHSAWGQFNIVGRVRPCDGFISLSKDYMDGDRGKWLYRGYLVGNANGNLAGRWRDTLSPSDVPGYEGCFGMSRRR